MSHAKPVAAASEDDNRRLLLGIKRLHVLAAPASHVITPQDDGSFEQRWIAPSPLASLAMMVLQDLTGNSHVIDKLQHEAAAKIDAALEA